MAKSAWGIELGTSSVKAVKMSSDRGSATLEEVEIISLKDFGLGSGSSQDDATAGALNDLRARKGLKRGEQIFVSISGQNTLGRIISLPPVSDDRIRETILNEAKSQIPIKLEEAVWDYQIIEDADPDERKVNLYAAKREAVDRIVQVCENAGLQVTGIQVAPLGIYNYIKYEMDDAISDCCVAIDIGADNTDVVIIDGQKTYVRVVPVAGNDITRALRARFKLPTDQAEKLKRNASKSKDAGAVFEAMKPPLKEMVGEIYRAVGFYKSQNEDANINQLVMMGNGSKLLNIKKFFEQQLQYQVHKVDAPQRVSLARSVDPSEVQSNVQSLAVAVGLALQGLGLEGLNRINLIPQEYISAKATEKLRTPFYVGGALAAAGGVIALLVAILSTAGIDQQISQADATLSAASTRQGEYESRRNLGEAKDLAYSLRNLVEGHVATIPASTTEDGDERPAHNLYVTVNEMPALLASAMQDALYKHLQASQGSRIYYANVRTQDSLAGIGMNDAAIRYSMAETPEWRLEEGRTDGGHYTQQRELRLRVNLATELVENTTAQQAYAALLQSLVGDRDGLLVKAVQDRLLAHFRQSGQLEGRDAAAIQWEGLQWVVNPAQAGRPGQPTLLNDIVAGTGAFFTSGDRTVGGGSRQPSMQFAVTEVAVIMTLGEVAEAAIE